MLWAYSILCENAMNEFLLMWHFCNIFVHIQGYFVKEFLFRNQNGFMSDIWLIILHKKDSKSIHYRCGTLRTNCCALDSASAWGGGEEGEILPALELSTC
jgi:hypothetical protein